MPSLLSLCLHSSTFNLLLFLLSSLLCSCHTPLLHLCRVAPQFNIQFLLHILIFAQTQLAESHLKFPLNPPVLLNFSHTGRQTELWPHPDPLLLQSPRQGVLAWLYPSKQQPGLSPAHQIDSVCVSTLVANTHAAHLLILIHPPSIDVKAQTCICVCVAETNF